MPHGASQVWRCWICNDGSKKEIAEWGQCSKEAEGNDCASFLVSNLVDDFGLDIPSAPRLQSGAGGEGNDESQQEEVRGVSSHGSGRHGREIEGRRIFVLLVALRLCCFDLLIFVCKLKPKDPLFSLRRYLLLISDSRTHPSRSDDLRSPACSLIRHRCILQIQTLSVSLRHCERRWYWNHRRSPLRGAGAASEHAASADHASTHTDPTVVVDQRSHWQSVQRPSKQSSAAS